MSSKPDSARDVDIFQVGASTLHLQLLQAQSDEALSPLARRALMLGYKSAPLAGKTTELSEADLEVVNYCQLKNFPEILVSFSHTKEWALSAWAQAGAQCLSIGVDLELQTRPIQPESQRFFLREQDDFHHGDDYGLLAWWCMKEACFKALWPYRPKSDKQLLLKDIWIRGEHFGYQADPRILGRVKLLSSYPTQAPSFWLALSVLEQNPICGNRPGHTTK